MPVDDFDDQGQASQPVRADRVHQRMTAGEIRALLFTLATTHKHVCEQQAKLRRVLRDTARELDRLDAQLADIEQSENYLREMQS